MEDSLGRILKVGDINKRDQIVRLDTGEVIDIGKIVVPIRDLKS